MIAQEVAAPVFAPFPSIARLSRDMIVTEKLDGTNAQVHITEYTNDQLPDIQNGTNGGGVIVWDGEKNLVMRSGSRNRWITPDADNFGFAKWVRDNAQELVKLGVGSHFGEWWGSGIQRGYGLTEKRFSLFNVGRWADVRPACCHVVPTLYTGLFETAVVDAWLNRLAASGSFAAPGFAKPEGVVVFHAKSGQLFKKTLDKNDGHKGA